VELVFVQSYPQVPSAIGRTAVDCVGKFLAHLIEGLAQVIAGFLGENNN